MPIRLVANLSDSVTSRADKFLAWNFLKPLQKEFCDDLLGDSTELLQWLEEQNDGRLRGKRVRCFALDFDSLYDSLDQSLVLEAVRAAFSECDCADSWSDDNVNWICELIELSLSSSVAKFGDNWYRALNGIPTGNSISVMLANITVFYVLRKVIYSAEVRPPELISLRRFVDDIGGCGMDLPEHSRYWLMLSIDSWRVNMVCPLKRIVTRLGTLVNRVSLPLLLMSGLSLMVRRV